MPVVISCMPAVINYVPIKVFLFLDFRLSGLYDLNVGHEFNIVEAEVALDRGGLQTVRDCTIGFQR